MDFLENIDKANSFMGQALPLIEALNLAPNPINYALCYTYAAKRSDKLNAAIDDLVRTTGTFGENDAQALFYEYIIGNESETNKEHMEDIIQVVMAINSHLSATETSGSRFTDTLQQALQEFDATNQTISKSELLKSISGVINELVQRNIAFCKEIQQTRTDIEALQLSLEKSDHLVYYDELTALFNRAAFNKQLGQLIRNPKISQNLSLIMIDIDHFKTFNDEFGHLVGDRVLHQFGDLLQKNCQEHAIAARYGGEEFAVILSNTSASDAKVFAEQVREAVSHMKLKIRNTDTIIHDITASFGVAQHQSGETMDDLIERADRALYRAKAEGRNNVQQA